MCVKITRSSSAILWHLRICSCWAVTPNSSQCGPYLQAILVHVHQLDLWSTSTCCSGTGIMLLIHGEGDDTCIAFVESEWHVYSLMSDQCWRSSVFCLLVISVLLSWNDTSWRWAGTTALCPNFHWQGWVEPQFYQLSDSQWLSLHASQLPANRQQLCQQHCCCSQLGCISQQCTLANTNLLRLWQRVETCNVMHNICALHVYAVAPKCSTQTADGAVVMPSGERWKWKVSWFISPTSECVSGCRK